MQLFVLKNAPAVVATTGEKWLRVCEAAGKEDGLFSQQSSLAALIFEEGGFFALGEISGDGVKQGDYDGRRNGFELLGRSSTPVLIADHTPLAPGKYPAADSMSDNRGIGLGEHRQRPHEFSI